MQRRALLCGLAASLATPSLATAATNSAWLAYERRLRASARSLGGGLFEGAYAAELLSLTNRFRISRGLPGLQEDPELALTARATAADMVARKFFAHNSPEGFNANDRVGLLVRRMMGSFGENLAYQTAFNRKLTPDLTFEGWRNSPAHLVNLEDPKFTHVGHAVIRSGKTYYSVAVFGGRDASLTEPLPLHIDGPELHAALRAAQPHIGRYMISEPSGAPVQPGYVSSGSGPAFPAGAWRLRPVAPVQPRGVAVLWGPLFVV